MLSKKDKEWLMQAIKAAVIEALTVEIVWEKVLDEKTGKPLAAKEIMKEDVYLPSFWTQHLKYHEGVYRGMRQTFGQQRDRLSQAAALNKGVIRKLEQVRKVFKGLQTTLITVNRFALVLEESGVVEKLESALAIDVAQIEDKNESSPERRHTS